MNDNHKICESYHSWYYNSHVWGAATYLGVPCLKSVSDMWNYQEILFELQTSLVIECGTYHGGSALFFAEVLRSISPRFRILTVDIDHSKVYSRPRAHSNIEFLACSSTDPKVSVRVAELRKEYPGPVFMILDSDHKKSHVLQELLTARPMLTGGDYLIVEDGNINGHPVLPGWGEGPYEAIQEYFAKYPSDYNHDTKREEKFGFTFAPRGFLRRR
jgi:cephalosporin hydroxylase